MTNYSLEEWLNSNSRPVNEQSTINEWMQQACASATPKEVLTKPREQRDPFGSHASKSIEAKNPFLSGFIPQKTLANSMSRPADKQKTPTESNPIRFTLQTPPVTGPSARPNNTEELDCTPGFKVSSAVAPDSTITKDMKKWKSIRDDFSQSLA